MKQSREVKGTVLCENFNEKFVDLIRKFEYPPELEKYLKYFENEMCTSFPIHFYDFGNNEKSASCSFVVNTIEGNSYYYEIHFILEDMVHITVYDHNSGLSVMGEKLFDKSLYLKSSNVFDVLFILPNTDEENASEQEQPEEDAEEPAEENNQDKKDIKGSVKSVFELFYSVECSDRTNGKVELTLGSGKTEYYSSFDEMYEKYKDNPKYKDAFYKLTSHYIKPIELTPLERTVFEAIEDCFKRYNEYSELAKVAEYGAEYNVESAEEIVRYGHLANEQIFNSDFLKELISKAGLDETYQTWLKERKKQEAVTVL